VKAFSYQSVKGYKNKGKELENWFPTDYLSVDSLLFTVFVEDDFVDGIYRSVENFNSQQNTFAHSYRNGTIRKINLKINICIQELHTL
jgi:hypothetical protein